MEVEPKACILVVRAANFKGEAFEENVGRFVAGIDHAAADGLGVLEFTDVWRDAMRFDSPVAAEDFVLARSPLRPTVAGEPNCPAAYWRYGWSWVHDLEQTEAELEAVDTEMADAVAEAAAHQGPWH